MYFGSQLKSKKQQAYSEVNPPNQQQIAFRQAFAQQKSPGVLKCAENFNEQGIVILDNFFSPKRLKKIQDYYNTQMKHYASFNPALQLKIFTGSATRGVNIEADFLRKLNLDSLLDLFSYHCGEAVTLADFRGYTSLPSKQLISRAWGWHTDGVIARKESAEFKVMVLLNDIEEGGQDMLYMACSEKKWTVHSQCDANFTPQQVLEFLKTNEASRIVRCYGKAGTIILFNGEGLHCATRGLTSRQVLVFTYRAINDSAIFPISITQPSLGSPSKNEKQKTKNMKQPLDTLDRTLLRTKTKNESFHIVKKQVNTPTINDAKFRFFPPINLSKNKLNKALLETIRYDLQGDLDLPAHAGNGDIHRDVLRISIRETEFSRDELNIIYTSFRQLNLSLTNIEEIRGIDFFLLQIKCFHTLLLSLTKDNFTENRATNNNYNKKNLSIPWRKTASSLAADLSEAFLHCRFPQELRTNVLFLYFLYVKTALYYNNPIFLENAHQILTAYWDIVKLDDYSFSNLLEEERHTSMMGYCR